MLRALLRLLVCLGGAALAATVVALVEARSIFGSLRDAGESVMPPFGGLYLNDLGVLFPVATGVGGAVGIVTLIVQPRAEGGLLETWRELRHGEARQRLRAASAAPVLVMGTFAWCIGSAHLARLGLAKGTPAEAGLTIGVAAVGAMVVAGTLALAFVPLVRRILAAGAASVPQLRDPALTGTLALMLVMVLVVIGMFAGDTSGDGGGILGILGVLRRRELDLRPLVNLGLVAGSALLAPIAVGRVEHWRHARGRGRAGVFALGAATFAIALALLLAGLCLRTATKIGDPPAVASGIERFAPLGKSSLKLLRRLTDRDHDGFSAVYAGGDCDDKNKAINPGALDVPGNGIDEDCSGADTPLEAPPPPPVVPEAVRRAKKPHNVILITVDTLRPDLGFMSYDKATSPNLDKIAAQATVFENAYSMASYTGKAVGPMLIGKYPSETLTDFSHFNTYLPDNVMVAERLHDAGFRTFAGMCHWYFKPSSGLKQGFDMWDFSAIPPGMGDNDNSITSERMADLALKMLKMPENTGGDTPLDTPDTSGGTAPTEADGGQAPDSGQAQKRFFAWFHFFDPHAQYVPHPQAPDFSGAKGPSRSLYDGEVWYTDKHIGRVLDHIAEQPWAKDTAIVMTADHGEAFYEHGMLFHGSEIWQELVHVPLFVYVPGAEPRRITQRRSHIDVVPTILELAGLPLPDDNSLRGRSLLNDVYLPKGEEPEERDVYVDMPAGPFNDPRRAHISGPTPGQKLIHFGGGAYKLFDLEADPDEKKDLGPGDKERLQEAIKKMNAFRGRLKEIEVKPPAK